MNPGCLLFSDTLTTAAVMDMTALGFEATAAASEESIHPAAAFGFALQREPRALDPEKCEAVFRKDHARTKAKARWQPEAIAL
jgi:hypothetical protein